MKIESQVSTIYFGETAGGSGFPGWVNVQLGYPTWDFLYNHLEKSQAVIIFWGDKNDKPRGSVSGLQLALGSSAMSNSIAEMPDLGCFIVTGSNTTETHPVIATFLKQAVERNGAASSWPTRGSR